MVRPAPSVTLTSGWYVPAPTGQPVTCPAALIVRPGGRPAAENDRDCPATGSAGRIWRLTVPPVAPRCGPGSSSGTAAGFSWSRSVPPGALIPFTVPALEYCQNPYVVQPGVIAGLGAVV